MDAHEASQLVLEWRDKRLVITDEDVELGSSVELGSCPELGFIVDGHFASRRHASVERRNQYYVLVDHSTNGTYVQTEDEQVTFLRRREFRLWGSGWLALGEPLSPGSAIRFQHT